MQQSACAFDTAGFRQAVDVWFSLELPRGSSEEKIRETLPYAMAIAQVYRQPVRVSFRTWPGTVGKESESSNLRNTPGGMGMDGIVRFAVDEGGKLRGEPEVIHDSPEIAVALRQALVLAEFPPASRSLVELLVRSRRDLREGVVSFARLTISAIRLEEEPRMVEPGKQLYPAEEKQVGRSGRVAVYYVINASGRVEPGTIYVYETTSEAFAESAEAMLMTSRFLPGRSGGCALATGVQQYINFVVQ
jgi:hypothetical protein